MRRLSLIAAIAAGSCLLANDAVTGEPLSAARCAAAETVDPSHYGDIDKLLRVKAWRALASVEPGGVERFFETWMYFEKADPHEVAAAIDDCRKIDPLARAPALPKPPPGDPQACRQALDGEAISDQLKADYQRAGKKSSPELLCRYIGERTTQLHLARQDLEAGRLACGDPVNVWVELSDELFLIQGAEAGLGETFGPDFDCEKSRPQTPTTP